LKIATIPIRAENNMQPPATIADIASQRLSVSVSPPVCPSVTKNCINKNITTAIYSSIDDHFPSIVVGKTFISLVYSRSNSHRKIAYKA